MRGVGKVDLEPAAAAIDRACKADQRRIDGDQFLRRLWTAIIGLREGQDKGADGVVGMAGGVSVYRVRGPIPERPGPILSLRICRREDRAVPPADRSGVGGDSGYNREADGYRAGGGGRA